MLTKRRRRLIALAAVAATAVVLAGLLITTARQYFRYDTADQRAAGRYLDSMTVSAADYRGESFTDDYSVRRFYLAHAGHGVPSVKYKGHEVRHDPLGGAPMQTPYGVEVGWMQLDDQGTNCVMSETKVADPAKGDTLGLRLSPDERGGVTGGTRVLLELSVACGGG